MRKNNKGFVVTEVLILSTIIIGVLIFMYSQFKNINRNYQRSFKYDTVEGMYLANNIVNYINDGNYDKLVNLLNNTPDGYIDITECNIENSNLITFCNSLYEKSEVEKIIFTEEDLTKIKANMGNFDNDLKEYINQIKINGAQNDYRIIIKYNDGTFATMRFNKVNTYIEDGLIVHLDGMNNTGSGHSGETTTWKDLSNHGNDATLYNNPTWSGNSLAFDGQTNYARLENTTNMTFENGMTWETRVKILSLTNLNSSNSTELLGNWESNGGGGLSYNLSNNFETGLYLINSNNNTVETPITSSELNDINNYYTIHITYDNTTLKMYIDGNLVGETSFEGTLKPSLAPIGLGGNPAISNTEMNRYANVEFQNVLIYNRALTEQEIIRNYQADLAKY